MFYCAFIESVLTFCIVCWFGNASEAQKKSVRKTVTLASKLIGIPLPSMESMYKERTITKAGSIVRNHNHPLASFFSLLPSGRRYRTPLLIPNRSRFSFVPKAITFLNDLGWCLICCCKTCPTCCYLTESLYVALHLPVLVMSLYCMLYECNMPRRYTADNLPLGSE